MYVGLQEQWYDDMVWYGTYSPLRRRKIDLFP